MFRRNTAKLSSNVAGDIHRETLGVGRGTDLFGEIGRDGFDASIVTHDRILQRLRFGNVPTLSPTLGTVFARPWAAEH